MTLFLYFHLEKDVVKQRKMILITLRWKHYEDKTPSQGYWSNCHCIVTSSLAPRIVLKIVLVIGDIVDIRGIDDVVMFAINY